MPVKEDTVCEVPVLDTALVLDITFGEVVSEEDNDGIEENELLDDIELLEVLVGEE